MLENESLHKVGSVNNFATSHISEQNSIPYIFLFIVFLRIVYFLIFRKPKSISVKHRVQVGTKFGACGKITMIPQCHGLKESGVHDIISGAQ